MSALPIFGYVARYAQPLADGVVQETTWLLDCAASGRAAAHLWQSTPAVVVPRHLTGLHAWAEAAARHHLHVRASGGGLVPQGPGVWNLSLVWPAPADAPADITGVYQALCDGLASALSRLGLRARAQEVPGSFCDGRFNLAVDGRKLVGTAQAWKRVQGRPFVLAHAVIVVDADPAALTEQANAAAAALGQGRPYRPEAVTSVVAAWSRAHDGAPPPAGLARQCLQVLAEQFARTLPPRAAPAGV